MNYINLMKKINAFNIIKIIIILKMLKKNDRE
jgi:hypothetical protein